MARGFNLNNIVWDKKTVIVIVAVCAVLLYCDIAFLMKMQFQGLATGGPKIKKLRKDIVTLNSDLAAMRAAQRDAEQQKGGPVQAKKLLNAEQIPMLLDKISLQGNSPGIKIMQLESAKPKEEAREINPMAARLKARKAEQSSTPPPQNAGTNFNESLLTLELSCDYHGLGVFLNQVDELPAVFFVQELTITPETNVRETAHLVLKVYVNK